MLGDELTATQIQLLKARATKFLGFRQQKILSVEHGLLVKEIDPCLAFGLLRHGYDENLPKDLSASVFVPFNKCLTICMQNGVQRNKECCEICDTISDLTRHASACMGHPEACPTCRSFFNLLQYHLSNCYTCDMHLCTKLKLKLLKYGSTVDDGLIELWPKIQQYISRLFPTVLDQCFIQATKNVPLGKQGLVRYPSVFDSLSTPPPSPALVARGWGHDSNCIPSSPSHPGGSNFVEEHRDPGNPIWLYKQFSDALNIQTPTYGGDERGMAWGATGGYDTAAGGDNGNIPTDLSSINSLSLNSLETKLKVNDGYGCVIMGEPRQLRQLAEHWSHLKKRLESAGQNRKVQFRTLVDGIILQGTNSNMNSVSGQYTKNKQWRKITYVGSGVAGKCYLAVDINTEAQFAVKKIDLLKYQAEELELWSELEHPNLVQLYGAMRVRNKVYIFSEFYAAGNMAEFIDTHTMLDQWLSLWFLQQLLDALTYLKKKDVLHEDIKADNIFLKPDSYKVGLGDFGLSRKGRCPPSMRPVGGQHHWSPEKAKSEGHGYAADVWAANCTFVHMLSGEPPWKKRFAEIVFLHFKIANDSPPIEDIPENLLTTVDTLIRKAWLVSEDDRPTATDLLQEECFQILYEGHHHTDPIFRSHIPVVEEDGMEYERYETNDSHFSIDDILEGMDNKENALEYINQLCASIDNDDSDPSKPLAASSPNAVILRKQYSVKAPRMESIVEEIDMVLDDDCGSEGDQLNGLQNIRTRRDMTAISPLMIPKRSPSPCLEKRHSWGAARSATSPSSSTTSEEALFNRREATFNRRETSPAIVLTTAPDEEIYGGLLGEKDIFDLNPGTSGYVTASVSDSYLVDNSVGMSLNLLQSADGPLTNPGDPSGSGYSSSLYESSHQWLGSSGAMWNMDRSSYSAPGIQNQMENRMSHIPLNADTNCSSTYDHLEVDEKFDLSSSLKMLRDSLPSSSSIDPRSILTIVNGLTQIDDTEVLVKGNETWQEIVEQNVHEIRKLGWDIDGYTYYLGTGHEVSLSELVPREKTNVYIYPTKENSAWQVRSGRVVYAPTR